MAALSEPSPSFSILESESSGLESSGQISEVDLSSELSNPQSIHMMNPEDGSTQTHQAQDQDPTTVEEIDETTASFVQPPDFEPLKFSNPPS